MCPFFHNVLILYHLWQKCAICFLYFIFIYPIRHLCSFLRLFCIFISQKTPFTLAFGVKGIFRLFALCIAFYFSRIVLLQAILPFASVTSARMKVSVGSSFARCSVRFSPRTLWPRPPYPVGEQRDARGGRAAHHRLVPYDIQMHLRALGGIKALFADGLQQLRICRVGRARQHDIRTSCIRAVIIVHIVRSKQRIGQPLPGGNIHKIARIGTAGSCASDTVL